MFQREIQLLGNGFLIQKGESYSSMQYIGSHAVQVEARYSSVARLVVVVVVADGTNQGTCELPDGCDEIKKKACQQFALSWGLGFGGHMVG